MQEVSSDGSTLKSAKLDHFSIPPKDEPGGVECPHFVEPNEIVGGIF